MASVTLVLITVSCITILSVTADRCNLQDVLFNGNYEFIDLGHNYNNATLSYPGVQQFHFTKMTAKQGAGDSTWYAANEFATGEHAGTHVDAPYHFYEPGIYIADLPLEKLIVPLIVVDVSSKVNGNSDFVLNKKDLDPVLNDKFEKPCVLLFRFGWSQYFNDTQKYFGAQGTKLNFPGLSPEVAAWIVSHKNIVGVGVDGPSVDPGSAEDYAVHRILSKAGLYNLENVNLQRPINEYSCTALVLPMKIEQGTGAPARLVAVCPKVTQ